jgi:hypothetical protein
VNWVDGDKAFTLSASRLAAFTVIDRHPPVEGGNPTIPINSRSQSSAESSACSLPNNCVTALKNAVNSRSATAVGTVRSRSGFSTRLS